MPGAVVGAERGLVAFGVAAEERETLHRDLDHALAGLRAGGR